VGFAVVLPAGMIASTSRTTPGASKTVQIVTRLYGPDVSGYIGYAPQALLSYTLSGLVLAPWVCLLLSFAVRDPLNTRTTRIVDSARQALVAWMILVSGGLLLIAIPVVVRTGDASRTWDWGWRVALALGLSALPALGVTTLIGGTIKKTWRAMLLAVACILLVGLWGVLEQSEARWATGLAPRSIDRALLSGVAGEQLRAACLALGWLLTCLGTPWLAQRVRARRSSSQPIVR
jgi:hypothetical protein